jgi:hypothetical protein
VSLGKKKVLHKIFICKKGKEASNGDQNSRYSSHVDEVLLCIMLYGGNRTNYVCTLLLKRNSSTNLD